MTQEEKETLINELDSWIKNCNEQAQSFFERKMEISESCSLSMAVAYENCKNLINSMPTSLTTNSLTPKQ